jgi:hypothetical protein
MDRNKTRISVIICTCTGKVEIWIRILTDES